MMVLRPIRAAPAAAAARSAAAVIVILLVGGAFGGSERMRDIEESLQEFQEMVEDTE